MLLGVAAGIILSYSPAFVPGPCLLILLMNMFHIRGGLLPKFVEEPNKMKRRLKSLRH